MTVKVVSAYDTRYVLRNLHQSLSWMAKEKETIHLQIARQRIESAIETIMQYAITDAVVETVETMGQQHLFD